jgi:hypothetical protein
MEPTSPMPSPSPERGGYQRRESPPITPEQTPESRTIEVQPNSTERKEVQQQTPAEPPAIIPAVPAQPFLPTPTQPTTDTTASPVNAGNPLIAADDDLIEKEWVDKAKKIVQQTRSDPYTQEKEVSKLQADYMKKRYGRDVKIESE